MYKVSKAVLTIIPITLVTIGAGIVREKSARICDILLTGVVLENVMQTEIVIFTHAVLNLLLRHECSKANEPFKCFYRPAREFYIIGNAYK